MQQNNTYQISYIEDDSSIRKLVNKLIQIALPIPVKITEYWNTNDFREAIRKGVKIDMLITGVGLPGPHISTVLPEFVQKFPDVPVIFHTGQYIPPDKRKEMEASGTFKSLPDNYGELLGIKHYKMLPKPFTVDQFIEEVRNFFYDH